MALSGMKDVSVDLVVTNEPKPVGRKQELVASSVAMKARELGIEVLEINKMSGEGVYEKIKSIGADYFVVLSFGHIFRKDILALPKKGFLNLHGSLLPKYRGASPIQAVLVNDEKVTGVCFMDIVEAMDAGGVYSCKEIKIAENELYESLYERMGAAAADLTKEDFPKIVTGQLKAVQQNEQDVTFCKMVKKEDGMIDFINLTAKDIYNKWRAYHVWPKIYVFIDGKKIILEKVMICPKPEIIDVKLVAGQMIDDGERLFVKCKDGVLEIKELKLEGKKSMKVGAFLLGNAELIRNKMQD